MRLQPGILGEHPADIPSHVEDQAAKAGGGETAGLNRKVEGLGIDQIVKAATNGRGATCPACGRGWQHVVFGIGEQSGDLATAWAKLIGDVAPVLSGGLTIGPHCDLPICGRDTVC